jgi:hypothetical protein
VFNQMFRKFGLSGIVSEGSFVFIVSRVKVPASLTYVSSVAVWASQPVDSGHREFVLQGILARHVCGAY